MLHHLPHAGVDAGKEFGARTLQTYLDDAEGTLAHLAAPETAERFAGLVDDLQGVYDAPIVAAVALGVIFGVGQAQLGEQGFKPFLLITGAHHGARLFGNGGNVVDAVAHGIDVHHRTARHHHNVALGKKTGQQRHDLCLITRSTVIVVEGERPHEIVGHARLLLRRGGGGADGNVAVDLARVGVENGRVEMLGDLQGGGSLAGGGGTGEDDEGGHGEKLGRKFRICRMSRIIREGRLIKSRTLGQGCAACLLLSMERLVRLAFAELKPLRVEVFAVERGIAVEIRIIEIVIGR